MGQLCGTYENPGQDEVTDAAASVIYRAKIGVKYSEEEKRSAATFFDSVQKIEQNYNEEKNETETKSMDKMANSEKEREGSERKNPRQDEVADTDVELTDKADVKFNEDEKSLAASLFDSVPEKEHSYNEEKNETETKNMDKMANSEKEREGSERKGIRHRYIIQEFQQLEANYKRRGYISVYENMKKHAKCAKNIQIYVAVTGSVGSGKSSFINAMRGLSADDVDACNVGVLETTRVPTKHQDPRYPHISFWDLPGLGGEILSRKKDYLKFLKHENYDYFVIISSQNTLTESDLWLAKEIKSLNRKCLCIRTHVDVSISNEKKAHPKSYDENTVCAKIKQTFEDALLKENLNNHVPVFLISNFEKERWDFPTVENMLVKCIPEEIKTNIKLSFISQTKHLLERNQVSIVKSLVYDALVVPFKSKHSVTKRIVKTCDLYWKDLGLEDTSLGKIVRVVGCTSITFEKLKSFLQNKPPMYGDIHQRIGKREQSTHGMFKMVNIYNEILTDELSKLRVNASTIMEHCMCEMLADYS